MSRPANIAILDLANSLNGIGERGIYHFSKREMLKFAKALLKLAPATSTDTARINALADAAGFVRGTADGAPAFRVLGNDSWHPDLRAAIDDTHRARSAAAQDDQ